MPTPDLAPIAANQRIEALDVVRGFALLGIFLMNIEFFNRTIGSLDEGMPRGLTGLDWFASWFIAYFVQGKFWTIFSLLFGMGFAVMLARAEQAGREFKTIYLRRVLALAVFGAAHFLLSVGRRHPVQLCGRRVDADGRALREAEAAHHRHRGCGRPGVHSRVEQHLCRRCRPCSGRTDCDLSSQWRHG